MCNAFNNMSVHQKLLMNNAKVNKLFHQSKQENVFNHLWIVLFPCICYFVNDFCQNSIWDYEFILYLRRCNAAVAQW